jgi:hypothetical protein
VTRRAIISDEAPVSNVQHTHPCTDCPFARTALPGWLGAATREEWVQTLHSDSRIDCHAINGPQCAGAAIYRANVCKMPRDKTLLRLEANRTLVWSRQMSVWTDPGRCSTCKYCNMDLDMNPYCVHAKVLEFHKYGVNLSKAVSEFCGEDLKLREEKKEE